jgi:hypothetical protein
LADAAAALGLGGDKEDKEEVALGVDGDPEDPAGW